MANTTVSNPYNFNINNNTRFSTTINAALPDEETILYEARSYETTDKFINLTIPSGVNVVKVYCSADAAESETASASVYSFINMNNSYDKCWGAADAGMDNLAEDLNYVGVTSGKTYKLKIDCNANTDSNAYLSISYSSKINTHAVDVEDY